MRRGPVVAGEQHRPTGRARRSSSIADALVSRTTSATTSTPRGPRRPRPRRRRCARRRVRASTASAMRGGSDSDPVSEQRGPARATTIVPPSTTPSHARARRGSRSPPTWAAAPSRGRGRAIARAIGCSDADSTAPTRRSASSRVGPSVVDDVDQRHDARGDGAGLVEHHGVEPACRLEHLRALDEDAQLRAAARADEERRRGGQAQCAGARDDEHGDGGGERLIGVAGRDQPDGERHGCDDDHDGHEHRATRGRRAAAPAPFPTAPASTRRPICASAVSAPTLVASTTSRPPTLMVAPSRPRRPARPRPADSRR